MRYDLKVLYKEMHEKKYSCEECLELFDSLNDSLNNKEDFDYITLLLCYISYIIHVNKLSSLMEKAISVGKELMTYKLTNKQKANVYYVFCFQYYDCSFGPKVFQYGLAFLNTRVKKDPINEITVINYMEIVLKEAGLYYESYLYSKKYFKKAKELKGYNPDLFRIIHINNSCYILLPAKKFEEAIKYRKEIEKIVSDPNPSELVKSFIPSLKFTVLYTNYYISKKKEYLDEYTSVMDGEMANKDFPNIAKQTVEPHMLFLKGLIESGNYQEAYKIVSFMLSSSSFVGNLTDIHRFLLDIVSAHPELAAEGEAIKIKDAYIKDLESYKEKQESIIALLYKEQMEYLTAHKSMTKMNKRYYVDPLTSCLNRASFEAKGPLFALRHKAGSLVFMDLDNFKGFNDTYGHDFGDLVLIEFSKAIRESLQKNCDFYRYAGDEFILLLPLDRKKAGILMEDVRASVEKETLINNQKIRIVFSYGISEFNQAESDLVRSVKLADQEMYVYKNKCKHSCR